MGLQHFQLPSLILIPKMLLKARSGDAAGGQKQSDQRVAGQYAFLKGCWDWSPCEEKLGQRQLCKEHWAWGLSGLRKTCPNLLIWGTLLGVGGLSSVTGVVPSQDFSPF